MIFSAALPVSVHRQACNHLLREDHQEDICFAIWYPSKGVERTTALVKEIILPLDGERIVNGNASFLPSYFERAIEYARRKDAGLALMHSHLGPGWQNMSFTDVQAEEGNAAAVMAATALPFVGLTLGTDGAWSARFWNKIFPGKYQRDWCNSVRVIGDWLDVTYASGKPKLRQKASQKRSVSAWGPNVQAKLASLKVGIIGIGSVGSLVGEALARMGVGHIQLVDFDRVERVNLDRTLHAYPKDIGRPKVEVLARALKKSSTVSEVDIQPLQWSVCEEKGFRNALDCDVLFSCVDRPWPRSVLNFIALSHLIPVIDGGIAIERRENGDGILRADWKIHTVTPTRICMECLQQYDPGDVQVDREGLFDKPGYIRNLPRDHPIKRNENVFGFAANAASLEILQFLSLLVPMPGRRNPGAQMYHYVPAMLDKTLWGCKTTCYPHSLVAFGDRSGLTVTGEHITAELSRSG